MSDTKVLNSRRRGCPQKITRHRADDGWHEEWTYSSRASEKTVFRFLNGKLMAVNSESAPQQVVQVTEQ
jgi:hypothetical protein